MSVPPQSGRRLSAQSPPCAAYAYYPTREELTLTAETTDSVTITVGEVTEPSMTGSAINNGKTWTATVTSTTIDLEGGIWTSPTNKSLG
jgi:hypothetical protein